MRAAAPSLALRISDARFVPHSHNISRGGGPDAPQTTDAGRELNGGSATVMSVQQPSAWTVAVADV